MIEENQQTRDRGDKIARVVLFTALMLGVVELSPVVTSLLVGEFRALVSTILFFATFALIYLIVVQFLKWEGKSQELSNLGLDDEDEVVPDLSIGAIAGVAGAAIVVVLAIVLGGQLRPASEITADLLFAEIVITVPVALFEELAYRGYMLSRMSELWGRTWGIIISSLVFSLFHFSWWVPLGTVPLHLIALFTFNLFLGGVVLSLGYYWSKERLWVPVGFHFTWNVVAYIMFPTYPLEDVPLPELFQIEWGLTTIPGFLIGLSVIFALLSMRKSS